MHQQYVPIIEMSPKQYELLHRVKAYPPCVKLTLEVLGSQPTPVCLLFKFNGSTTDMDMEIILPLGNVPLM